MENKFLLKIVSLIIVVFVVKFAECSNKNNPNDPSGLSTVCFFGEQLSEESMLENK